MPEKIDYRRAYGKATRGISDVYSRLSSASERFTEPQVQSLWSQWKSKAKSDLHIKQSNKIQTAGETISQGISLYDKLEENREDAAEIKRIMTSLGDLGYDTKIEDYNFTDVLRGDARLKDLWGGAKYYLDGEEASAGRIQALGTVTDKLESENIYERIQKFGGKLPRSYDISNLVDSDIVKEIITAEQWLGGDSSNVEYEMAPDGQTITNIFYTDDGGNKQEFSKRSMERNSVTSFYPGTYDNGAMNINSAFVNKSQEGLSNEERDKFITNPSDLDDTTSAEHNEDGSKDVLWKEVQKVGRRYYDDWDTLTNKERRKFLQDNIQMNIDMGVVMYREGGTGGISPRGGITQWAPRTYKQVAKALGLKRASTTDIVGGSFVGESEEWERGDAKELLKLLGQNIFGRKRNTEPKFRRNRKKDEE